MKKIKNFGFSRNTLLIVGVNTRPIAKSAKKIGFKTVVVDNFGDLDVYRYSDVLFCKNKDARTKKNRKSHGSLFKLALKALESHRIDAIITTSGMEHNPLQIEELKKEAEIIGNGPDEINFCENEEKVFLKADDLGIPHPDTEFVQSINEALRAARGIGYPVLLKSSPRGGGVGIKLAKSPKELKVSFKELSSRKRVKSISVQQFINGIDASASVLSNGRKTECLTINGQIIGERVLGVPRKFGYCGGIVPLDNKSKISSKIIKYSQAMCNEIGLIGSNGLDFVIAGERPYLIEINPRFQSTMDLIEGVLEINLLAEHIQACQGQIGEYNEPRKRGIKLITYAKKTIKAPDLTVFDDIADIPPKDSVIKKGNPICSILKFGEEKEKTIKKAYDTADKILKTCHS